MKTLDLEGAIARLAAINRWLESAHPQGGVWLDHVDDEFMDAWDNADGFENVAQVSDATLDRGGDAK